MRKTTGNMSKTKRPVFNAYHYKSLANIISNLNLNKDEKFVVFLNFSEFLKKDNPRFNQEKFQLQIYSTVENPTKKGGE